ncbi:MAG: DMT family transporter [Burkholderiales bacterium]
MTQKDIVASVALLTGALVWGLIWYPYRVLAQAGLDGASASLLSYAIALVPGLIVFRRHLAGFGRSPGLLTAIALSAGWCNLAYVLAMLRGEVMLVLLLFYLAPLWTVILARLILGEKPRPIAYLVVVLAAAGAMVMLWRPGMGPPVPHAAAEWLGLSAGAAFALANVLSRRAQAIDVRLRSLAVWAGVTVAAAPIALIAEVPLPALASLDFAHVGLLALTGTVIFAVNVAVQEGLARLSANRAIVLFLTELVFAALAAHFLAAESTSPRQWLGGAMIVAASLLSGRLESARSAAA